MKTQWHGHSAVTRARLLAILERAARGAEDFSVSERALYTACEFWVAVESRTLRQFLGADVVTQLRYVAIVYTTIGAAEVVQAVESSLKVLTSVGGPGRLRIISALQERLLSCVDPLNDLITRFAQRVH